MSRQRHSRHSIKRSPIRERMARRKLSPGARAPLAALALMLLTLTALAAAILAMPLARVQEHPGLSNQHHLDVKYIDVSPKDLAS